VFNAEADTLVSAKKLLPAARDKFRALYLALTSGANEVKFSADSEPESLADGVLEIMRSGVCAPDPKLFSETAPGHTADHAADTDKSATATETPAAPPTGDALDAEVRQFCKDEGCDYATGLRRYLAANRSKAAAVAPVLATTEAQ
ncbi:MAG: hypothetical protein KDA41_08580, partial [Planctomycetales bacterium]|nr:hypothetical protein [Planctomycetales bacterium]